MKDLIKPASECPNITKLADACNVGACNPSGIIRSFGEAINELSPTVIKDHPAVKCILGQLSYLCNESLGPSPDTILQYERWKEWVQGEQKITWEQAEAIWAQKQRWSTVGEPQPLIGGDGAIAIGVGSLETGVTMSLCIERDGHVHS